MKEKLRDYIDMIFADAPDCRRTKELKEEMYANVCDKYDDLIAEGKSEAAAYNISVSSIGDISDLIDSIRVDEGDFYGRDQANDGKRSFTAEEKEQIEKYRVRSGIMTSIAVALYIMCWIPLVVMTVISEACGGNVEVWSIVGLLTMMVMIAVATGLMIFKSSLKPLCLKGVKAKDIDDDDDDDDDDDKPKSKIKRRKNPVLKAISSSLWSVTIVGYLAIGFLEGLWHPGWMVFLIATAIDNIIEAIFEIAGKKYL